MNAMVAFKFASGLNAIPCRSNLDEHALLLDSQALVELNEVNSFRFGRLLVEGEGSVDFSGDAAGDDVEDLLAKLDEQSVYGERALLLLV